MRWFRGTGWCQARRRTHVCEQALEWGADLIVQLDADQVYEPDVLCRLLGRLEKGCGIVAAMVPSRSWNKQSGLKPFGRCAWKIRDGKAVPLDPEDGDLQEAEFPTSACVMFAAEDLQRLPKPWYFNRHDEQTGKLIEGEDGRFFLRMKEIGVKSYVDTTIKVKHCHTFQIDDTFSDRFADWAEGGGEPAICDYG